MPRPPDLDELRAVVRAKRLRATPSRLAVLKLLRAAPVPMSHAEIVEHLSTRGVVDRATIHRNLAALVEADLVRRTDLGDRVWRFDAPVLAGPTQPLFVCTECGRVESVPDVELVVRRGKVRRCLKARHVEVLLRGACDECGS